MSKVIIEYVKRDNSSEEISKNITVINRFALFKYNEKKCVALLSCNPLHFKKKAKYFIYEDDQNTYDPRSGKIISDNILKEFVDYLLVHPHTQFHTKGKLSKIITKIRRKTGKEITKNDLVTYFYTKESRPDDLKPHHILEDIERSLLDGVTLSHLLKTLASTAKGPMILSFIAGISVGFILIMLMGLLAPDTISLRIGK